MNAIDTNIWIYSQDNRDKEKQQISLELIATTRPLALPWQVGCEFVAASRKLVAHGFSQDVAWNSLEAKRFQPKCLTQSAKAAASACESVTPDFEVACCVPSVH